jgi:hypothetical protein
MLTNAEVAKRFSEGETKGASGNMFIDRDTIYSYGYHFPIARMTELQDTEGRNIVLFTSRDYSNTTAKHKSYVHRYLSSSYYRVIEIDDVKQGFTKDMLDVIYTRIIDYVLKAKRARKEYVKQAWESQVKSLQSDYHLIQSLI